MTTDKRQNRIPIMLSDQELADIDGWRFENRVATRAEAVRRLLRLAIEESAFARKVVATLTAASIGERPSAPAAVMGEVTAESVLPLSRQPDGRLCRGAD